MVNELGRRDCSEISFQALLDCHFSITLLTRLLTGGCSQMESVSSPKQQAMGQEEKPQAEPEEV